MLWALMTQGDFAAPKGLTELLKRLKPGEVITLTEADGTPRAVLVGMGQPVRRPKGLSAKNRRPGGPVGMPWPHT